MLLNKLEEVINNIFDSKLPEKIAVGVSGGIDSIALVFLLKEFTKNKKIKLIALIVDHKIRENSTIDANDTAQILQKNNIECQILNSYLGTPPQANIEANLREMRYSLLNKFCLDNNIKHLFIGHHEQDQAENFLIRLFRGSGIDGLSAMDYVSKFWDMEIIRPLLNFKKEELKEYLEKNNINWIEDESNQDKKYLRNKIRSFLNSLDDKNLINQRIALASKSILESKKLIEQNLIKNASKILEFNNLGYILLKKAAFCNLSEEEAKRYLAWTLMEVSGSYYKPRLKYLENLYFWILEDKEHKKRCFYGCVVQKYDNSNLIIYREKDKIKKDKFVNNLIWDNRFKINCNLDINGISISNIEVQEFNKLDIKHKMNGILKNIICTIPVFRKSNQILAIPHLNYYVDDKLIKEINIRFDKKTKL